MTYKNLQDAETDVIEQALDRHNKNCPYRKDKDAWFDSKMLKILGVGYGIAAPWFIWATVSIFTMQSDIALTKQKIEVVQEINQELKQIRGELTQIKIDLAYMKKGQ